MHERISILGIPFHNITIEEFINITEKIIKEARKKAVMFCTPNTGSIVKAQKDEELFKILKEARVVIPESTGILFGAKLQKKELKQKITSQQLIRRLVELSHEKGYTIYFLGAEPGIADQARLNLLKLYPNAQFVGVQHGYFNKKQEPDVIAEINSLKPNILIVTLGVPRQEKWVYCHREELKVDMVIGLHDILDYEAGKRKMTPIWIQKIGLEWFWKLCCEPGRMKRIFGWMKYWFRLLLTKDKTKGRWDRPVELLQEPKKDDGIEEKEKKGNSKKGKVKHRNQKRKNKKNQMQKRKNQNKRKKRK